MNVRHATENDAEAITRLHVAAWRTAYRGILPDEMLDALDTDEQIARRRELLQHPAAGIYNWVIEDGAGVHGWAASGPPRDEDLGRGTIELYAIYLQPAHFGTGLGRALLDEVTRHARDGGAHEITLWVLHGNERARRFYAAAGYGTDERTQARPFRDTGALTVRLRLKLGEWLDAKP